MKLTQYSSVDKRGFVLLIYCIFKYSYNKF